MGGLPNTAVYCFWTVLQQIIIMMQLNLQTNFGLNVYLLGNYCTKRTLFYFPDVFVLRRDIDPNVRKMPQINFIFSDGWAKYESLANFQILHNRFNYYIQHYFFMGITTVVFPLFCSPAIGSDS